MLFSQIGISLIQILETRNSVAPNLEYHIQINNQTDWERPSDVGFVNKLF
jgi:hypothetical protein